MNKIEALKLLMITRFTGLEKLISDKNLTEFCKDAIEMLSTVDVEKKDFSDAIKELKNILNPKGVGTQDMTNERLKRNSQLRSAINILTKLNKKNSYENRRN